MSVEEHHPNYSFWLADWIQLRDCSLGERHVKLKGTVYLPATSGQIEDGQGKSRTQGEKAYQAYKTRAVFPEFTMNAWKNMVGIMHSKPAVIELPTEMEYLLDVATVEGESLEGLLRRVNEEQLLMGRLGLLADIDPTSNRMYVALYASEAIVNWDNGARSSPVKQNLNLVVLNETENERQVDFSWELVTKYRVCVLGDPTVNEAEGQGLYTVGEYREEQSLDFTMERQITPTYRGTTLDEIPFVFINSSDLLPEPCRSPMMTISNLDLRVYRGEADFRQALFMQGQDTLVLIGDPDDEDTVTRMGAGAKLSLPMGGDAKFIGVDGQGLPEMAKTLQNDRLEVGPMGSAITDNRGNQRESGEALTVRLGSRTANLHDVSLTGAAGVVRLLKIMGKWMGLSEDKIQSIKIKPNTSFVDDRMEGRTLIELMTAKNLGAPISQKSVHRLMRKRELTEMSYEEETDAMDEEPPDLISGGPGVNDAQRGVQGLAANPAGANADVIPGKGDVVDA